MQKTNPAVLPRTWSDLEVRVKESPRYAEVLPLKSLHDTCDAHITTSNLKWQGSIPTRRLKKTWSRG